MSYLDIDNLYKNKTILLFRECYALEKIHGTSAHISWKEDKLSFFSGGAKHPAFLSLFDQLALRSQLDLSGIKSLTFFGEAYGGNVMKMKQTYGDTLKFVVFEVKVGEYWLNVPAAAELAKQFGFDFVPYCRIDTTLEALDAVMKSPSVQAIKLGMGNNHTREGVVLRPIEEMTANGGRVIAKHKNPDFKETKSGRPLDEAKLKVLDDAKAISDEWVTEMRLTHVLDGLQLSEPYDIRKTGDVVRAMLDDITKESTDEIIMSPEAKKTIGQVTARMYKSRITNINIKESDNDHD
jgi:hypothetical protein